MTVKFHKTLFLFRRDLRLEDNIGLIFALQFSKIVIPAFVFTTEQIERNPFKSEHCLQFMIESLKDLDNQLREKGGKLFYFKGNPEEIVAKCIRECNIDAVIVNRDYTPYSRARDEKLKKACTEGNISFYSFDDALLHPPEKTLKKERRPYTLFTPYFRNASKQNVLLPIKNRWSNYFRGSIAFAGSESFFPKQRVKNELIGGRAEALNILKKLSVFANYGSLRGFPAEEYSATHLSPYLKFTICSPREVYAAICHQLSHHHALVRSLYWRDFFTSIAFFFPHIFTGSFHPKFDSLPWSYNKQAYQRWCEGSTGFPIVDAGMREMNETGFMHNRVRMITASFLIKDLHIDWRWGEKYFAQTLIDYDPAVNNGNWQWVASTGSDAQPYFRIFNPWLQQRKWDPECIYIKKWIPELHSCTSKVIHTWNEKTSHGQYKKYPAPMVDHQNEAEKTLQAYQSL